MEKVKKKVTTSEIYEKLKVKIEAKLDQEPYVDEEGNWVDPLPARDLATLGSLVLKMADREDKIAEKASQGDTFQPFPVLPELTINIKN
jgi:hypothetical protein